MPIYEYQCQACGKDHEALQKVSDAPLEVCPACEAPALRKKVSAPAFRLKGGGWYETDFKTGDKKNLAGDKGGDSKADTKADTRAESKTEPKSGAGTDKTSATKSGSGTDKGAAAGN